MSNHTRRNLDGWLPEVIQEDMRGQDSKQASMLCLISPESVVPPEHPLRGVKKLVEVILRELTSVFDAMYSHTGRPSIPPERLLKATVLMALYTVRSERMFCEQLGYNRKEAKLSYCLSALMENRNGLLTSIDLAFATGYAERASALAMLDGSESSSSRRTVGADAGYDTNDFVAACRDRGVTPHVAQNRSNRRSAIDGRTTRWEGYSVSIAIRRMIERVFGWMKTTANFRRTRLKGRAKTAMAATFVGATYNIMRLARLLPSAA